MKDIQPKVLSTEIACAETAAPPCALVIFGASGDLVQRKLIPSLLALHHKKLLSDRFCLIGCGRTELSDQAFREKAVQALAHEDAPQAEKDDFVTRLYFVSGDYNSEDLYRNITNKLEALNKKYDYGSRTLFYLSVPPLLYGIISEHLRQAGLACSQSSEHSMDASLIVEKPFGHDLASAHELNTTIGRCFKEDQIYRIDHYLGKETVQNILMFRFANTLFEPVWNRNYIDHIQITIAETLGVEHRGEYYDHSGALRDMFQNHMLQMLAMIAMEPPVTFEADSVRDEKLKLLRSLRPLTQEAVSQYFVRGQYAGYTSEPGVARDSKTETYVAAKLHIDNWRWRDVHFYLRTGKRLAAKTTEIAVTFKRIPHSLFASSGLDEIPPNVLVMKIQPEEGMSLRFQAKRPGSKLCMGTLNMDFSYEKVFGIKMPESYQRLLLDCMLGDQTLFMRFDTLENTWRHLDPVLKAWAASSDPLPTYDPGSDRFDAASQLIEADGRSWRPLD
ncbi:MAG: glucose-6-phosphate dehydrogenase [Phycisphaerae bacterium]|nr:glucose-6-phosphate dehydrogenase [Phycisphaerae bacterium]